MQRISMMPMRKEGKTTMACIEIVGHLLVNNDEFKRVVVGCRDMQHVKHMERTLAHVMELHGIRVVKARNQGYTRILTVSIWDEEDGGSIREEEIVFLPAIRLYDWSFGQDPFLYSEDHYATETTPANLSLL